MEDTRNAEIRELGFVPAHPHSGDRATPAQDVERGEFLGQQDGVSLRDDDYARTELQPGMARPDPCERLDRLESPAIFRLRRMRDKNMVCGPDGFPAESFGRFRTRLDRLRVGTGPRVAQYQSVSHGQNPADLTERVPRGRGSSRVAATAKGGPE